MSALRYAWEGKDARKTLKFYFSPCTRVPAAWKEEVFAAARTIANRTTKPIVLCSGGGIDSEIACRGFYEQGIHFSVLTLRHAAGTNEHDIQYAIKWCKARGVEQRIVEIDMEEFLTRGIEKYLERYIAIHPFRYMQIRLMELVEEMNGYAVLSGGEQLYVGDPEKKVWTREDLSLPFAIGFTVPFEWCKDNGADHEPFFYFSTPELCLSYMRLPLIDFALSHPDDVFRHKANTYTLKRIAYQSVWPDLEVRYKFDGYEKIRPLAETAAKRMANEFGEKHLTYKLPVSDFERQLSANGSY